MCECSVRRPEPAGRWLASVGVRADLWFSGGVIRLVRGLGACDPRVASFALAGLTGDQQAEPAALSEPC